MPLPRLGLRAQIVLSLSAVFALSSWFSGYAALQLTRRSAMLDEARTGSSVARTLAVAIQHGQGPVEARLAALCEGLGTRLPRSGVALDRGEQRLLACGATKGAPIARTKLQSGETLSLWLTRTAHGERSPMSALLTFYLALTGLAVLALAYIALTVLIVRPLERLTLSAEALSTGNEHVFVRAGGSAETARLAQTFNEMAVMLRAERKRLVDRLAELERATGELRSTEQQLIHGEKLASIGRLAAGVAHEIGNPLAAILGLLELLREGGLTEAEQREFLERIQRETERIHRIIRDLLDFARHDVSADGPQQTADLREVIKDAVSLVRPQKESRDVAIEVAVDDSVRRVVGPQHRLTQVVLNLLLNALDALEGRGKIAIGVQPSTDGEHVLLIVEDDGPGIAPEMVGKLFDPFTTTKPAGRGTGLGLAVSHAIVDGLSGSITAENRPEGGARFEVRLRKARPGSSRPPPPAEAAAV